MVAAEHLEHFLREAEKLGLTVLLAGVRPEMLKVVENLRFREWLPGDRIFHEDDEVYSATLHAVRHAHSLLRKAAEAEGAQSGQRAAEEPDYYLV